MQPGAKPKLGSGDRDEALLGLLANLSTEGIGHQWIRPRPPRLPIQDGEVRTFCGQMFDCLMEFAIFPYTFQTYFQLVWLNPDSNHELVWDHGMCADTSKGAAVRDLIAKALKGPLAPAQQEVLLLLYVSIYYTQIHLYKEIFQVVLTTNIVGISKRAFGVLRNVKF